jgi:tRNA threonylcarbamoyladenosine modification (KEOPS) complex Cgi121 subunit
MSRHPDFAGLSDSQRMREFQKMVLESQASGCWGEEKQKSAIAALERFNRGEEVQAEWRIDELVKSAAATKQIAATMATSWQKEPAREPGDEP